jgi:probable phosphoglycerate mutase
VSTRFILVRHGETQSSLERRFAGSTDVPLTDHGREQAAALAHRLRPVRIDAMHVSPLLRCRETAQAITDVTGRKAQITDDIRECSFGDWENLTLAEVLEKWPDGMRGWIADEAMAPPGGESWADLGVRVERWFGEASEHYAGRTMLAITHGGPIIWLGRHLTAARREAMGVFMIDTASVSIVQIEDGRRRIRVWNDVSHMRDPLLESPAVAAGDARTSS